MEDKNAISQIRKDYKLQTLDESQISPNPIVQLENWLKEAITSEVLEPTAFVLSTVSETNRPSSRVVLLKGIAVEGLQFFTNYNSRKGKEIENSGLGAANFFWPELERQVRIEGQIRKISSLESDVYFASRPRGSKIGALASPQSEVIEKRKLLEDKVNDLEQKFEGKEIPRPEHWGGYVLLPDYFEFWQGRTSRLHDRITFQLLSPDKWKISRLAP